MDLFVLITKLVIVASIFFVWVVRYSNIIEEFQEYGLPAWFRDLMGIIKLSACLMIISNDSSLIIIATGGLAVLMFAALITHIKAKHAVIKMMPSFTLMCLSVLIGLNPLSLI